MKQANRLVGLLGIMIGLVVLAWIVQILTGNNPFIDQWTRGLAESLVTSQFYEPFRWMTNFGSRSFLVPFVIITALLLFVWYRDWFVPILFACGTLLSYMVNLLIKQIVARERPSISVAANAEGNSFPSGHAMISLVCYGLLAYFIVKKIKSKALQSVIQIGFALFIFLIGMSRFVINVHYLTDIIAGFFIGYLFLICLLTFYLFVEEKRKRRRV